MKTNEAIKWQEEQALQRYQLIAPLLDGSLDNAKRIQMREAVAEQNGLSPRTLYRYEAERGIGHVIHTYRGDGDPRPSFSSLPVRLDLSGEVMAEEAWDGLSPEHRVALYLRKGKTERIINRLEVADGEA